MKNYILFAIFMFAAISMTAQKRHEDKAHETVKEISEAVDLTQMQLDKLYISELKYNIEKGDARKANIGEPDKIREQITALNKISNQGIQDIIGASGMKSWMDYQKDKKDSNSYTNINKVKNSNTTTNSSKSSVKKDKSIPNDSWWVLEK